MESNARLRKSKFAYNRQKTKEEKQKEIEGLPKYIKQNHITLGTL